MLSQFISLLWELLLAMLKNELLLWRLIRNYQYLINTNQNYLKKNSLHFHELLLISLPVKTKYIYQDQIVFYILFDEQYVFIRVSVSVHAIKVY